MNQRVKKISVAAMLCALAFLSVFVFRIKVQFLTYDAKDAILAITSLLFGPIYGVASAALVEFLTVSDTGVYGLIMNFASSGTFALTCGLIYRFRRTYGGAIAAASASVFSVTAVMLLMNLWITPLFMGAPRQAVIDMIPSLLLPFNLLKAGMNAAITLAIYKPFVTALRKTRLLTATGEAYHFNKRSVVTIVLSVLVAAGVMVTMLLVMNGQFQWVRF